MRPALRPLPCPQVSPATPTDRVARRMAQSQGGPAGAVSSPVTGPVSGQGPLCDWIDTQAGVLGLWLDRLIEQGDPDDLVSLVHRQQLWLELMRGRVARD